METTVTTQPLADDDRASMLRHAQQTLVEQSARPAATSHGQPDRTTHQHATAVVRLVEEVDRLRQVASQLDADLRDAVVQQRQLLRATERLRLQRIVVLGPDRGGDCALCLTGRYSIVSAATELYLRPDDGVVVAISGVPIVECDVCGHSLVTLDVARGVEALRDLAEARPGDRDRVLWLDWSDRPGRGAPDAKGRS